MKPFNIFIALSIVIIFGGFFFFKDSFKTVKSNPSPTISPELLMDRMSYLDYSKSNQVLSKKYGKTVLFFAATTWCQTCSALDKEIKMRLRDIPLDVTILKVDYDNDREMKTKYGVTQQHTLVVLDKDGNELKRWIGGNFDLMLNELKEI
ncbi:thioredoxin family protein [Candidatus Daviesbacteria bacterium]|nr:thioredoxin family protein [Candidatus Daviesbacteria bacterium]